MKTQESRLSTLRKIAQVFISTIAFISVEGCSERNQQAKERVLYETQMEGMAQNSISSAEEKGSNFNTEEIEFCAIPSI